jgi:transposase
MIELNQIWCIVEPVDLRHGIDGLSQWIQSSLSKSPCDGTAWAFANRAKTRMKLVIWDGTGVWCCQRRLHRGSFVWPTAHDREVVLTAEQWNYLIKGVDWQRISAQPNAHWRV